MKITDFVNTYIEECKKQNIDPQDTNYGLAFIVDKTLRMKMIEQANTIDSEEYQNLKKISEKYSTQFQIIKNKTILNWLLLQKEDKKDGEDNSEIIKNLLNITKNNTKDIDKDHKTLTESSIKSLFEINKGYELINTLSKEIQNLPKVQLSCQYLYETYQFYYLNDKPYGIVIPGGAYVIEKVENSDTEFKYRLAANDSGIIKNFTEQIKGYATCKNYIYDYIEDFNNFKPKKGQRYCYPRFIMAIISGVCGIYEPLSNYILSKNMKYLNSYDQIKEFINNEVPKILATICINNEWIKTKEDIPKLIHDETFNNVVEGFKNAFILDQYEKGLNTKIRICNQELKANDSDSKNRDKQLWVDISIACSGSDIIQNITIHRDTYSLQCASKEGNEVLTSMPSWAYRNIENIIKSGGIKWNDVPLGMDMKSESSLRLNFQHNFGWMVNLIAGSGSGKGVTTMAIVGAAFAMKYPILYLDCKPDMANSVGKWGAVGIDGNENGPNHFITKEDLSKMTNRFKELYNVQLGNGITQDSVDSLCRTLVWCRAVEIFMHLVHIRAQYKGNDPVLKEISSKESKSIHPVLVMDEFEAESQIIHSMLTAKTLENIERGDSGGLKKVNTIDGGIVRMLEKDTESLNRITNWVKNIWGTGPEGMRGQIKTAFGRQAGCLFFTISQDIPSGYSSDTKYGSLMVEMLKDYINTGFIAIYGVGTDSETTKYSLSRIMPSVSGENKLQMGQFGVRQPNKTAKVKTFLTIDDAIDPGYNMSDKLKGTFKNVKPLNIKQQVLEQIADNVEVLEDDNLTIKSGHLFEHRVDTLEYIYSLANQGKQAPDGTDVVAALKPNFNFSVEYFEKFCQALYGCSFKDRLTTVEKEDFYNYLGCSIANETNKSKLLKVRDLENYAKALYSWRHKDEIDEFFRVRNEEDRKIADESQSKEEVKQGE